MKLSETNGPGAPTAARRFWREVDATPPSPDCEECVWPEGPTCGGCKHDAARRLAMAEAVA